MVWFVVKRCRMWGLIIGVCVLAVAVFCLSGFIAYWLLIKRKMGSWLRSLCKCLKSNEEKTSQNFARKKSLVLKGKPEIVLVEGSLQSTSHQVPEEFRQKLVSEDDQPPELPPTRTYSMKHQNSKESGTARTDRLNSSTSATSAGSAKSGPSKYERNLSSLSRQRPKVAAPPVPVKTLATGESDGDFDDVEIIDNDIYGTA